MRCSHPSRPTSRMNLCARSSRSSLGTPRSSRPNATFASTVSHGKRAMFWKTIARSGPGPRTGVPSMRTSPASMGTSPAIARSSVVFPHPDGPMIVRNSFSLMARLMSCSASTSSFPFRPGKILRTPISLITASLTPDPGRGDPRSRPALESAGHVDEHERLDHDQYDHRVEPVVFEDPPEPQDEVADPDRHHQELHDHHARDRAAEPDPYAGHDRRERGRQQHATPDLPLGRAEAARHLEERDVDLTYAGAAVDDDHRDGEQRHEDHARCEGESERHEKERNERRHGGDDEDVHVHVGELLRAAETPHGESDRDTQGH